MLGEPPRVELTPEQTADLRRQAKASQHHHRQPGRRVPIRFQGGPLDGIRIAVSEPSAATGHIGFALLTPRGPVRVRYRREGAGEVRTFDAIEPGWRGGKRAGWARVGHRARGIMPPGSPRRDRPIAEQLRRAIAQAKRAKCSTCNPRRGEMVARR